MNLPDELQKKHSNIIKKFYLIRDDWKKYEDQIIPQDNKYAKEIIKCTILILDFCIQNIETIDKKEYRKFLAYYDYDFFYGPSEDDFNYLAFDEKLGDESLTEFMWPLRDDNYKFNKENLTKLKEKYEKILKEF